MAKNLEKLLDKITMVCDDDLTDAGFKFVEFNASTGNVTLPTAGGNIFGVVHDEPEAGQAAEVVVAGQVFLKVGTGGVTQGDYVTPAADGTAVVATTGDAMVGQAVVTAGEGELAAVKLGYAGDKA